jgi:SAM-dependent methyltransferase
MSTSTTQPAPAPADAPAPSPGAPAEPTPQQQGARLLGQVAGYVAHRTIAMGLRTGLIRALAASDGAVAPARLAALLGADPSFVAVWCRAALSAGLCDTDSSDIDPVASVRLAPHVGALLLDEDHPAYLGGVFEVLEQPEVFERFEGSLTDGATMWWSDCRPEWIDGVAGTGRPFYTRLIPGGLHRIPGLAERLAAGCTVLDSSCGSGAGLVRLATSYPACRILGVDGDGYSLQRAADRLRAAGLADRCELIESPLEELSIAEPVTVIINNISMHECRDIDRATERLAAALQPGGYLVISDFPFPDTVSGLRSVPGQVMSGIQFFEAQIDDQLLPRAAYPTVLARHGFTDLDQFDLSPVHTVTSGRAPDTRQP